LERDTWPANSRVIASEPSRAAAHSFPLVEERVEAAKIAFTCRRVPKSGMRSIVSDARPGAGDLVLARITRKRQHTRIELPTGRKATLFVGDEIIVSYGNRYASDQFESLVPEDLRPCHLVASGGVASMMVARHRGIKPATEIDPIGLVGDDEGRPLNLRDFALSPVPEPASRPLCLAVIGSAMNAGKTTSAASLARAFREAGHTVGAAKITGTGSGGDYWKLTDAGAHTVLDFTDAGYVSTYLVPIAELCSIAKRLTSQLKSGGADVVVLEIADGVFQEETAGLVQSSLLRNLVDGYFLAVTDSLSAAAGVDWMVSRGLPLLSLCGTISRSPLASREAVATTGMPVLTLAELSSPDVATNLLAANHTDMDRSARKVAVRG